MICNSGGVYIYIYIYSSTNLYMVRIHLWTMFGGKGPLGGIWKFGGPSESTEIIRAFRWKIPSRHGSIFLDSFIISTKIRTSSQSCHLCHKWDCNSYIFLRVVYLYLHMIF